VDEIAQSIPNPYQVGPPPVVRRISKRRRDSVDQSTSPQADEKLPSMPTNDNTSLLSLGPSLEGEGAIFLEHAPGYRRCGPAACLSDRYIHLFEEGYWDCEAKIIEFD
jgi:hypothetical protein